MASDFEDALSEITGASSATAPQIQQEQAAPSESNAFEQALADKIQESTPADRSHEAPEPGGGMER